MEHRPVAPPMLIVVSGPSGVGKDATLKRMQERGLPFHFLVTTTTRPPRSNETEGVDYFFSTVEGFNAELAKGKFLEHANVYGNLYGNKRADIEAALAAGRDVIMRIDVQGAATIRRRTEGAIFIFLLSTLAELEMRLRARRTESEEALKTRLERAAQEMEEQVHFDYCLENRDTHLDQTVDDIMAILRAEQLRTHPRHIRFKS